MHRRDRSDRGNIRDIHTGRQWKNECRMQGSEGKMNTFHRHLQLKEHRGYPLL